MLRHVHLQTWIAFCTTETLLCLIPGPAVLYVVSLGVRKGASAGLAGCFGVLAGNALYFALSCTGVAALIIASHDLFVALKWCGAGYLIWQGVGMLLRRNEASAVTQATARGGAFVRGFAVQVSNPKALIFFVALLPQFIDPSAPLAGQVLLMGASSFLIELAVLSTYIAIAERARRLVRARFATALERVAGTILIALGVRLALAEDR